MASSMRVSLADFEEKSVMKSDDRLLFGLDTPVVIDCIKSAIDSVIDTKI